MKIISFNVFILILVNFFELAGSYGAPCNDPFGRCDFVETCEENMCVCSKLGRLTYTRAAAGYCKRRSWREYSYKVLKDCSQITCADNKTCIEGDCVCGYGSVLLEDESCVPVNYASAMEPCYIRPDNNSMICYSKNKTLCLRGTCICYDDYYYNSSTNNCETKESFKTAHNLRTYKERPGGYCVQSTDCIDGLMCTNTFECACPFQCELTEDKDACDCGELEFPAVTSVFIVGATLGVAFLICWGCIIKHSINNYRKTLESTGVVELTCWDVPQSTLENDSELTSSLSSGTPQQIPFIDDPPPYSCTMIRPQTPAESSIKVHPPMPQEHFQDTHFRTVSPSTSNKGENCSSEDTADPAFPTKKTAKDAE